MVYLFMFMIIIGFNLIHMLRYVLLLAMPLVKKETSAMIQILERSLSQ